MRALSSSFVSHEKRNKDKYRDDNMDKIITQLVILTKTMMRSTLMAFNDIASSDTKVYDDNDTVALD